MKNHTLYCICIVLAVILLNGCRTTCPPHHSFKKRNIIDSITREVEGTSFFIFSESNQGLSINKDRLLMNKVGLLK